MSDGQKNKNAGIKPLDAYRRTNVMTANRESILLMLYAGALRFLRQSMEAAERGDLKEKTRLVGKVQEIVIELRSTLNFEVGGELAKSLDRLYDFISNRLVRSNFDKGTESLGEVLPILETLNNAWEGAVAALRKGNKS